MLWRNDRRFGVAMDTYTKQNKQTEYLLFYY